MKTISFKVPESLMAKLSATARKRRQTKSAGVRAILEDVLSRDPAIQTGSCLELAADVAGCVQGPEDLSFNTKHLRGYVK